MRRRFAYMYFMKPEPKRIQETVAEHVEYWSAFHAKGLMGGPFAERTGGLITFEATDLAEAVATVELDPFNEESLVEEKWIKEWVLIDHEDSDSRPMERKEKKNGQS